MDGYVTGNTGLPTILKTVPGKLDYPFDWAAWLAPVGETITDFLVTVQDGLTLVSSNLTGAKVIAFVDGGENGKSYLVDCWIKTATREETRSIVINVVTRR